MKIIQTILCVSIILICLSGLFRIGYSIWPILIMALNIINLAIIYTESLLEAVNVFFFQWFFVRLTKCREKVVHEFKLESVNLIQNGTWSLGGNGKYTTYEWYAIQYWILPFSGWYNRFVVLSKECKSIRITKKKIVDELCKQE